MDEDHLVSLFEEKSVLIFDFDGTIANTASLHEEAFYRALQHLELDFNYSQIAGLKTKDAVLYLMNRSDKVLADLELDLLVKDKQNYANQLIASKLNSIPAVDTLLQWAKTHFKLAIVSSGSRRNLDTALKKLEYIDLFSPVICADSVLHAKPNPEGYLLAVNMLDCTAEQSLV